MAAVMGTVLQEAPLAVFTAIAPIGAGAFTAIAAALITTRFTGGQLRRIDRFTLVPAAFAVGGIAAALFHRPGPAIVLDELFVAVPFLIVMAVYIALALAGKLDGFARKALAVAVAAVGLTFAAFMGLAYDAGAPPAWASPWPVLQMLGFALVGGAALGAFVLALANVLDKAAAGTFRGALVGLAVVGGVLALSGFDMLVVDATAANSVLVGGTTFALETTPLILVANVGLVLAFTAVFLAARGDRPRLYSAAAVICAVLGTLAARATFYALQAPAAL